MGFYTRFDPSRNWLSVKSLLNHIYPCVYQENKVQADGSLMWTKTMIYSMKQ